MPFEWGVLHNFPYHVTVCPRLPLLKFSHEHLQILISVPTALPHVELINVP
jgi:hypothetical protein